MCDHALETAYRDDYCYVQAKRQVEREQKAGSKVASEPGRVEKVFREIQRALRW